MYKFQLEKTEGTFIGEEKALREVKLFTSPHSPIGTEHFAFGMTVIEPGQEHEVHQHQANGEVQLIYEGAGLMRTANGEVFVEKGDVVGLEAEESHGFVNTGGGPLKILWIYYPPGQAEEKFLKAR